MPNPNAPDLMEENDLKSHEENEATPIMQNFR